MVYNSYDSDTQQKQKKQNDKNMKILKSSIIASLLLFMTSCNRYYIPSDKGVVISIKKVENINEVTIKINTSKLSNTDAYITFLTNKQYNIDDVVYFTK